jgi:shikimate kinase
MIISLVGMSGSGKTHWSRKLAQAGYERLGCDDLIERRLADAGHMKSSGGIESVARWMGQPYEAGFARREAAYLAAESAVVNGILDTIERSRKPDGETGLAAKLAIDTTGSVIYLGEETCRRLQALTTIVYLETAPAEMEEMFGRYLADPKPVVWSGAFQRRGGEADQQALDRCYRDLLHARRAMYGLYAAVKIPAAWLREAQPDAAEFLHLIGQQLSGQRRFKDQRPSSTRP